MNHLENFRQHLLTNNYEPINNLQVNSSDWQRLMYDGEKPTATSGGCKITENPDGSLFASFGSSKDSAGFRSWRSNSNKEKTQEEIAEERTARASHRKFVEQEEQKKHVRIGARLERVIANLPVATSHPYLTDKKIEPHGIKIRAKTGELIIPRYGADNRIYSLQRIQQKKSGVKSWKGYFKGALGKDLNYLLTDGWEDFSIIALAEGFATGASIHEATGYPVYVCFDAGGLEGVAVYVRKKYPNARIFICADSDQWSFAATKKPKDLDCSKIVGNDPRWTEWRDTGKLHNTGLFKAGQAAAKVKAHVITPDFPSDHPQRFTDFNDAAVACGKEYIKMIFEKILEIPQVKTVEETSGDRFNDSLDSFDVQTVTADDIMRDHAPEDAETAGMDWIDEAPPLDAYSVEALPQVELYKDKMPPKGEWRAKLFCDENGKILKTMGNTLLFLENHEVISNLFCYDEFCEEKVVYRCPPWENAANFKVRSLTEEDKTHLTVMLEKFGVVQPFATVERLLDAIIRKNTRNPAMEYFNNLVWDGVKRLDTWLKDYCGCVTDDARYVSAVGRKWLTAGVFRVFEAGCKFDHMLILEGKQRIGKSLVLRELATFRGRPFFEDTLRISDLGSREAIEKMQGKVIIEFAELSGMGKADADILKQTITNQEDKIRKLYQNTITVQPRKFIMAGTYNPNGNGIFTDTTGNERFWVVKVGDKLDIEGIQRDKEQLWAEAVAAYKAGEKLYLEGDVAEAARQAQGERMQEHAWEMDIHPLCHDKDKVFAVDIWNKLELHDRIKRRQASNEVAKIMTQLGFARGRARNGGEPETAWIRTKNIHMVQEEMLDF